jgi:hypothetical protein
MIARLITIASSVSLLAGAALAQPDFGKLDPRDKMEEHMDRGDERPPMIILGPPEDFRPPEDMPEMNPESPEEAKRMVAKMFFRFMDRSGDGVLDFDEFGSWIQDLAFPGGMPGDMDDDGRRKEDDRDHMDDDGRRKEDDHGQMDEEDDGRGNENPMDMARRKRDEARRRMEEKAQGRMDGEDDHPEHDDDGEEHDGEEMDHKDDGDRRDSGNPMDKARGKMDEARKRMEQAGGDIKDHMEEEGREHMEEMMMDGFDKSMHPDLAKLPDAPHCSDELRERELSPQREGAACRDRDGNLMFRTVCTMPGFGAAAISLPRGRAASCFGIRALSGKIGFEIVSEDGRPIWNMAMGKESYEELKLEAGVYHIKATGGDRDGAITVSFVDVSTER